MARHFVTLGQQHAHRINGITVDCDCVVEFEASSPSEGRDKAVEYFGLQFCTDYHDEEFNMEDIDYFPRGIIKID